MKILARSSAPRIEFDPDVQALQMMLNDVRSKIHGFWPSLNPDGKFGVETEAAVRAFQTAANIKVDGRVGLETWNKLYEYSSIKSLLGPNVTTQLSNGTISGLSMNIDETSSSFSVFELLETVSKKVISPLADYLKDVSDNSVKQIEKLSSKKVTANDINRIVRGMFEKPDLKKMREEIMSVINKTAHGNTNVINYKRGKQVQAQMRRIAEAKQMQANIKKFGTRVLDKDIAKQVFDKCIKELESVNFSKKITDAIKKSSKLKNTKITGGGILTFLGFIPLIIDTFKLGWAGLTGKPTEELLKELVTDILEFLAAAFLGAIIAAIVGLLGITGGTAILVILVLGIIVSHIIACFAPDLYENLSEGIINGLTRLLNSPNYKMDVALTYKYV